MKVDRTDPSGTAAPATAKASAGSDHSCHSHDRTAPLAVRVELVLVDGEAGKQLTRHQAAVVREVLAWLREHHPTDRYEDQPLT